MILGLYSIKDKLTDFGGILTMKDDEIAKRVFEGYCKREKNENYIESRYFELYKVGTMDSDTGVVNGYAKQEIELLAEGQNYEQKA